MSTRVKCQWMKRNKPQHTYKDEPCNICLGKVVLKGVVMCPFHSETYMLFQSTQHLVTADERLYSIQAGIRADNRRHKDE